MLTQYIDDAVFEIFDVSGLQGFSEGIMIVQTICAQTAEVKAKSDMAVS